MPDTLKSLLEQRLALAKSVAAYKFASNLPIRDPKREIEELAKIPAKHQAFFQALFKKNAIKQKEWIESWQENRASAPTPADLIHVLRPKLDSLNQKILHALPTDT